MNYKKDISKIIGNIVIEKGNVSYSQVIVYLYSIRDSIKNLNLPFELVNDIETFKDIEKIYPSCFKVNNGYISLIDTLDEYQLNIDMHNQFRIMESYYIIEIIKSKVNKEESFDTFLSKYLKSLKRLINDNPSLAIDVAHTNLINTGIIDLNNKLLPPYDNILNNDKSKVKKK